jgi:hypothetical protein
MTEHDLIRAYGMRPDQFDLAVDEQAERAASVRAARVAAAIEEQAASRPTRLADQLEAVQIARVLAEARR